MKRVLASLLASLLIGEARADDTAYAGRGRQDMASLCAGMPFYDQVDAYYPLHASNHRAPGRAVIDCGFDDDGHVSECEVISEDPVDRGFGGAALMIACSFSISRRQGHAILRSRNLFPETSGPLYAPHGQMRARLAVRFFVPSERHGSLVCSSPTRC
jgi:hypothetical protein